MAYKTVKEMGVSPVTNRIYYGKMNVENEKWVGDTEDVTETAIASVFQWFLNQMEGKEEVSIKYPKVPGIELKMVRKESEDISVSKDAIQKTDIKRAVEEWNKLQDVGIAPVTRMKSSAKRYKMLQARIREYGINDVIKAISKIRESDFLMGKKTDFIAKFDWFVTPTYFPKILDGFYDNSSKEGRHGKSNNAATKQATPLIPFDQWDGSNNSETPFA